MYGWGSSMADPLLLKRLVRNLRYRLTYIKVYETFLQQESHPEALRLLRELIATQQSALAPLSGYLQVLGATTQGLPMNQKLLDHAASQTDRQSRMCFVHYGLEKAVSWYKEQLMDKKMTADPALRQLLFELGEREAASLWRTEVTMVALGMRREPISNEPAESARAHSVRDRQWRSRKVMTTRRATWPR
jgi:hypothetical protein